MSAANRWVVTAKLTDDGSNVWRRLDGTWSGRLDDAGLLTDEATARAHVASASANEQRLVCDPYVIEVGVTEAGKIDPPSTRERIRANGPTIRLRRPDTPDAPDAGLGR